jgi:hypothetical protein
MQQIPLGIRPTEQCFLGPAINTSGLDTDINDDFSGHAGDSNTANASSSHSRDGNHNLSAPQPTFSTTKYTLILLCPQSADRLFDYHSLSRGPTSRAAEHTAKLE